MIHTARRYRNGCSFSSSAMLKCRLTAKCAAVELWRMNRGLRPDGRRHAIFSQLAQWRYFVPTRRPSCHSLLRSSQQWKTTVLPCCSAEFSSLLQKHSVSQTPAQKQIFWILLRLPWWSYESKWTCRAPAVGYHDFQQLAL
jgi:hypothetical protein